MARGFNKAIIVGNLARDPQLRYTASKSAVASFSVAVNRSWKGKNGEIQEAVDFIPIVVWGPQAENCERYLRKGSAVLVEGRIQVRSYDDKTGNKRYVTEIVSENIQFLSGGRRDEGSSSQGYQSSSMGDEPSSFRSDYSSFGSDSFPMDISEIGPGSSDEEADIPF